jgi:hypothetical protein
MTAKVVRTKPATLSGDLAHLPAALAPLVTIDHWVIWRWEWRKDGWTKPPYMAAPGRRTHAKNNDPATWSSYSAALAAVQTTGGKFDGIGFALLKTSFDVVDLDHCVDPATGEADAWARAWVDTANGAYVERTPSGTGLRIICGGDADAEKLHRKWPIKDAPREKAWIEIYRNCERYITITGAQIGDCKELGPGEGLLEKIRAQYEARFDNGGGEAGFDFNQARAQADTGKVDYDEVIRNGAPAGVDVSALFHSVVGHLYGKGMSLDEIVEELGKYPYGIGQRYVGRLQREIRRSLEKFKTKQKIPKDSAPKSGEPDEELTWDTTDKKNIPRPTCTNARRALRVLGIDCRYDRFHDKLLINGESDNLDHLALALRQTIHKAYKFDPGTKNTIDALIQLCRENEFDPVADYLNGLTWDKTPRLDRWLSTYLGAEDNELNRAFGRITLVAGVRRVRHPGVKFDPITVLEGPMGTEKSKAIETLAGIENFSDQTILGARDREQQELLAGVWLFEIAELSNIRKTEVEHIKSFASRTHDRARPAYGRTRVDQPRRCILFATTNDDRYLKMTDRRFWPVRTAAIDIEALKHDRDQLWAEAAQRENEGASIVLDRHLWGAARVEQEAREEQDPWDDVLAETIGTIEQGEERVSSADLLGLVLGIHVSKQRDIDYKRLGRCMRRLGWEGPKKIRITSKQTKGYTRPAGDTV